MFLRKGFGYGMVQEKENVLKYINYDKQRIKRIT
jgi:hypothetical protein